jgi:hypothetical protein
MSLESDFHALSDRLAQRVKAQADGLLHRAYQQLVLNSPVLSGRFSSNWKVGVNEVNHETTQDTTPPPLTIPAFKLGDQVFITNALPYALGLEYGHSKQAPNGIAAVTAAELQHGALTAVEMP